MQSPEILYPADQSDIASQAQIPRARAGDQALTEQDTTRLTDAEVLVATHGQLVTTSVDFAKQHMAIEPPAYCEETIERYFNYGLLHAEYVTPPIEVENMRKLNSQGHTKVYATMAVAFRIELGSETIEAPKRRFLRADTVKLVTVPSLELGEFDGARLRLYTGYPGAELKVLIADANLYPGSPTTYDDEQLSQLRDFNRLFHAAQSAISNKAD